MKTGTRKPEPYLWLDIPQYEYHVVEPAEFRTFSEEELSATPKKLVTHKYVATSLPRDIITGKRQFRYVGTEGCAGGGVEGDPPLEAPPALLPGLGRAAHR